MDSGKNLTTLWGHISSLRLHLIYGVVVFVTTTSLIFSYGTNPIIDYLLRPLKGLSLVFLSPLDPFIFKMDISLYAGGFISLPICLALLLHFVFPALTFRQKIVSLLFIVASIILGILSIVVTYFYLLPITLTFLISLIVPGTSLLFTAKNYITFIVLLIAIAFIVLQLPVIIVMLSYIRLVNPYFLAKQRRFLYLGLIILLAIVTPTTDVVTLMIVSIPAILLTEIGIAISKAIYYNKRKYN